MVNEENLIGNLNSLINNNDTSIMNNLGEILIVYPFIL